MLHVLGGVQVKKVRGSSQRHPPRLQICGCGRGGGSMQKGVQGRVAAPARFLFGLASEGPELDFPGMVFLSAVHSNHLLFDLHPASLEIVVPVRVPECPRGPSGQCYRPRARCHFVGIDGTWCLLSYRIAQPSGNRAGP